MTKSDEYEERYGVKQSIHRGNKREITTYKMRWGKYRACVILSRDHDALAYPSRYSVLQQMWEIVGETVDEHLKESIEHDWQLILSRIEGGESVPVMRVVTPSGMDIDLFQ